MILQTGENIKIFNIIKRKNRFLKYYIKINRLVTNIFDTLDGHTTSRKSRWRLFTMLLAAITLASVDAWQLHYKKHHGYTKAKIESVAPDAMQSVYDYFQFLVDLFHINKYDKETSNAYYKQFSNIDVFLGGDPNADINRKLNKLVGVLTFIWITNVVYTSVCNREKGIGEILIFVSYHIFLFTKILTILSLIAHTLRIEHRLRMIGDAIQDCYKMSKIVSRINVLNEYRQLSARIVCSLYSSIPNPKPRIMETQKNVPFKIFPYKNNRKVLGLGKCYLILTEQCHFVNNMFAIRILMHSLNLTVDMVRFINSAVRYAQGSQYNGETVPMHGYVVWSAMRTFVPAVIFFSLVHYCERAYKENDRIVRLADHVIVGKHCEADVHSAVSKLRALAYSRPISFTAANFFRFEYPVVTTIVATVTNYSIILFQSKS